MAEFEFVEDLRTGDLLLRALDPEVQRVLDGLPVDPAEAVACRACQ